VSFAKRKNQISYFGRQHGFVRQYRYIAKILLYHIHN
jgi:hypothetical protein